MLRLKKKLYLILALFIIQLLPITAVFAQADPTAYIQFDAPKIQTGVNETFPINITINTRDVNLGVSGFNICVKYNPQFIHISSIQKPKDSQKNKSIFTEINNTIDNDLGKTCFSYVVILPDNNLPHTIYSSLNAKSTGKGTSSIEIVDSQIVGNIENDEYKISANSLSIETTSILINNTSESISRKAQRGISSIVLKIFRMLGQLF